MQHYRLRTKCSVQTFPRDCRWIQLYCLNQLCLCSLNIPVTSPTTLAATVLICVHLCAKISCLARILPKRPLCLPYLFPRQFYRTETLWETYRVGIRRHEKLILEEKERKGGKQNNSRSKYLETFKSKCFWIILIIKRILIMLSQQ